GASPQFTRYVGRYRTERSARIVEAVVTAADGLGTSPLAVACGWVRDRAAVASVVIGARDRAQLLGSLAAEEITLPAEIRSALDDVSAERTTTEKCLSARYGQQAFCFESRLTTSSQATTRRSVGR